MWALDDYYSKLKNLLKWSVDAYNFLTYTLACPHHRVKHQVRRHNLLLFCLQRQRMQEFEYQNVRRLSMRDSYASEDNPHLLPPRFHLPTVPFHHLLHEHSYFLSLLSPSWSLHSIRFHFNEEIGFVVSVVLDLVLVAVGKDLAAVLAQSLVVGYLYMVRHGKAGFLLHHFLGISSAKQFLRAQGY
jgi:hypothetical protein